MAALKTVVQVHHICRVYRVLYSAFSLKDTFSVSKGDLALDLNTALYQPIKSKHKIVKGILIAR